MTRVRQLFVPVLGVGTLLVYFQQYGLPRFTDHVAGAPTPMLAFIAFSVVIIGLLRVI